MEKLLLDPGIVRNRLKVEGTVKNAKKPEPSTALTTFTIAAKSEAERPNVSSASG